MYCRTFKNSCWKMQLLSYLVVYWVADNVHGSISAFYQPGPGAIFETWLSRNLYSFQNMKNIPDYPSCPTYVQNGDSFATNGVCLGKKQYGRYRAFFTSSQTGMHKFFAVCGNQCKVYIEKNPTGSVKMIDVNYQTGSDWGSRKSSNDIELVQGYRYEITASHISYCTGDDYFKLGVQFPDGTESKPIQNQYLKRSMSHYKWTGVIAQKYGSFAFPSWDNISLAYAYANNPSYPNSPSSYTCKSTLYDEFQYLNLGDSYALRYIGYLKVATTGVLKLKMWCNEICEFFLTKSNVESSLGQFVIRDYSNPGSADLNAGQVTKDVWYPFKAFMAESMGSDYIRVTHKQGSSRYVDSWRGMLQNLPNADSLTVVPLPMLTVLNSTAIEVRITSAVTLPASDSWTSLESYEILYFKSGDSSNVQKLALSGTPPVAVTASGLSKYTDYNFYLHFLGRIAANDHHIISRSVVSKTDEDVPDAAPPGLVALQMTSSSIFVKWNTLADQKQWNGVGTGYELQYKAKGAHSGNWTSNIMTGVGSRQFTATGLAKYTVYEFRVAGRTSKGSGKFSGIVEERTMEDVPSSAPANVTARNASSSSIEVSWEDIPSNHQNGIIIGYKVYFKKALGNNSWNTHEVTGKSSTLSGLQEWTFYDFKVSAKTSVGEGPISNYTTVRTDEDRPAAPPLSIVTAALSSQSINVSWSHIDPAQTNGLVVAYVIRYRRADGKDLQNSTTVYETLGVVNYLAEYTDYEIEVAGMTRKGAGVFSTATIQKTLEDAPSASPIDLRGEKSSSTAVQLHWGEVPSEDRNGVIVNYTIKYQRKFGDVIWKNTTLPSAQMQSVIGSLDFYTIYRFRIAAWDSVGIGPFSNATEIRTDADAPSKSPQNLTGNFLDHQSIEMKWERVPEEFRHGIILGYKLHFKDISIPDRPWRHLLLNNSANGTIVLSANVTGLKIFTPYALKIQAFNYRSLGKLSDNITVWTDEYPPEAPPRNLTGQGATSTGVILKWKAMDEVDGDANGRVTAYTVQYHVVDCHDDRPEGCDEGQVFNLTSNGSEPEIRIAELRKFTKYSFVIQVVNSKGEGNFSHPINVTTDEDTPEAAPALVETWPSKVNAIKVFWSPIPESLRNGLILGYRIFYKPINVRMLQYHRAPRAINPFAIFGAQPGEQMKEVSATVHETEVAELRQYSWYQIRIGAFTSKGLGVTFTINGTAKQGVPTEAPMLTVADMTAFHQAYLSWDQITEQASHGEVIGYRIQYYKVEAFDFPVSTDSVRFVSVFEPNRTAVVQMLDPFAKYSFQVQAFTEAGFGVWSNSQYGSTCRCPKVLSTARISIPPLANMHNLDIIPALVDKAMASCCGNCVGRHGISYVDWHRDALNRTSMKYSKKQAMEAIASGTHLAVPIFENGADTIGDIYENDHVYVPLLSTKNLLVFIRTPTNREMGNAASAAISRSLWKQWPLCLLSLILTVLAAIVFWVLESRKNESDFSRCFFKGTGSGLWLAFITMTTVGYGDLVPKTNKGRFYTIFWTLIGLVFISMVVGNLSSLMAIDFVFRPIKFPPNGKVLTSEELFMTATKLYGRRVKIGNVSDGNIVKQSLVSGDVTRVIIDYYQAWSLKAYLDDPRIILEEVLSVDASYGIVLAGEAKRVQECIRRNAKENEKQMLDELSKEKGFFEISYMRKTPLINYMLTHDSDLMDGMTFYGGVILVALLILGILSEIRKKVRDRAKIDIADSEVQGLFQNVSKALEKLENDIVEKVESLECKHGAELMKLNGMHYGKTSKLVSMYPDLSMFDPAMPKSNKTRSKDSTETDAYKEHQWYESDGDSLTDMPIDYMDF